MSPDDRLQTFRELSPLLRSLAYRMLGSVADAEDVVQDAFVRWQRATEDEIRSPSAYLTTIVTRLCIDARRSARSRREQYVGAWLPEPIADEAPSAEEPGALVESLSVAFLVLLENLSPVERAVYLLHYVFDLEYAEVAPIVGKSEENCRQIARRAKAAIGERAQPRFAPTREERHQLAIAFAGACRAGSIHQLATMLAEDAELWSDGGARAAVRFGRTRVARRPIVGKRAVARFISAALAGAPSDYAARITDINGEPGVLGFAGGRVVSAITFDVREGLIRAIYIVADPAKLARIPLPS